MKVSFNTILPSVYSGAVYSDKQKNINSVDVQPSVCNNIRGVNPAYFTFCAKPDSVMLLSQSNKFLCAYSRKPMISPYELRTIFAKLSKKTNAQSAINFLREYRDYMPEVETEIFDMFENYGTSGKKNFQDILIEKRPEALARLKQKQTDVLHGTDEYILSLGNHLAEELFYIRDIALLKVKDGTFGRSEVLRNLENKANEYKKNSTEREKVHEVYKMWYKLPRSLKDYDAFIVKYSKSEHNDIAQRLLSMAVATVEHVKAYSSGGEDKLSNYVLARRLENTDRMDINLAEYDELNPDIEIRENLQKYVEDVCGEIMRGNSYFANHNFYPAKLRQNIIAETSWDTFMQDFDANQLNSSTAQVKGSKKGANRYRQNRK